MNRIKITINGKSNTNDTKQHDTIQDVINNLAKIKFKQLNKPEYRPSKFNLENNQTKLGLAVEDMHRHMTDEGWQIFDGLQKSSNYILCGHNLTINETDVKNILHIHNNPKILILQDKREWDTKENDFRNKLSKFENVNILKVRDDIFKLTILKDAQNNPLYHRESANEIDVHAWVIYYHPRIVSYLAGYVRPSNLVRTYHSINKDDCPVYTDTNRDNALLSGAISSAYPLRNHLVKNVNDIFKVHYLPHPGYHRDGCATPNFLKLLTKYKVSICTASKYGYALRKIIESTACGCIVISNLPKDEVIPEIDNNIIRISSNISIKEISELVRYHINNYDSEKQRYLSEKAINRFNHLEITKRLANDIEYMRVTYNKC